MPFVAEFGSGYTGGVNMATRRGPLVGKAAQDMHWHRSCNDSCQWETRAEHKAADMIAYISPAS